MSENSLQTHFHQSSGGIQRHKSFKDKIQDFGKGQLDRTKSLFMDAKHEEAAKKANLSSTQKLIDLRQRQRDYRLAIDHLAAEYALAKDVSCMSRYGKMKLMVKRILMQDAELSKVNTNHDTNEQLGEKETPVTTRANGNSSAGHLVHNSTNPSLNTEIAMPPGVNRHHKDIVAKLSKFENMSRQDIIDDTKKMDEEAADIGSRLALVRTAIQRLDEEYNEAKQFAPWDRYIMLKKMIKHFLTCKNTLY